MVKVAQEPLKEKVVSLEIKQAVTDESIVEIKENIKELRKEVKVGFDEVRKLVFKGLVGIIGILLTAIGYCVKMFL